VRLAQFISRAGHCSRRQASRLIDDSQVLVNGVVAGHLTFITKADKVTIGEQEINTAEQFLCYRYYKPVGIDCNLELKNKASLIHYLPQDTSVRLYPIGRLDKDSCGLLLLTNDGKLTNRLLSPAFKRPKIYDVTVSPSFKNRQQGITSLNDTFINGMAQPLMIKGCATQPCDIVITGPLTFRITMTQGLNRQIRRMSANQGFKVTHLRRINFAGVSLAGLELGEYKPLTAQETNGL